MSCSAQENSNRDSDLAQVLALLRQSQERNDGLLVEQQRMLRRMRRQVAGILVFALIALVSVAMATSGQKPVAPAGNPASQGAVADRDALLSMLSADERVRVENFESQLQWLSAYMKSSPDFDPGAAVALFLSQVADNMNAVPKMHREMQVMNARMAAVPAMVAEMQAINAKLAVMTGAMDSTMGRAGRMMPWMPFSP